MYLVGKTKIPSGETIAYRKKEGTTDTVMLIHGNASSSVHWETTMDALDRTVIAPDLRGFGHSSYNAPFGSLRELAQDLRQLAKELGLGKLTLVGWSTGGGVAYELAAMAPEVVKKVVTLGAVPVTGYPMFKKDETGAPIFTEPLSTREEIAADPVQVVPMLDAIRDRNREFLKLVLGATLYSKAWPAGEDIERYVDAILMQRCLVDTNYSLVNFNMQGKDGIGQVKCPIVMLHGTLDAVVPLALAQKSQEDIKAAGCDVNLVTLGGCGHSPITDDPKRFFEVLRENL